MRATFSCRFLPAGNHVHRDAHVAEETHGADKPRGSFLGPWLEYFSQSFCLSSAKASQPIAAKQSVEEAAVAVGPGLPHVLLVVPQAREVLRPASPCVRLSDGPGGLALPMLPRAFDTPAAAC